MRTAAGNRLGFVVLLGGLALVASGAGCRQSSSSNQGSGGSQSSGGSSSGGSQSSGGSSSGGSQSSGGSSKGGSQSSGGQSSGGSSTGGSGGSSEGGSGGSSEGGSGGSSEGGSGGGSSSSGSEGGSGGSSSGTSGQGGSGGSSEGGSGSSSSGTSGQGGSGGSSSGTSGQGGSTASSPGCSGAIKPANGSEGGVTDFTDYSTTTGKWGNKSALFGSIYGYPGASDSTMKASVDTSAKNLRATGTVTAGDYAGFGLTFEVCATVAEFKRVQFTVAGSVGDCNLELQIKTFDQTPTTATPPGGCADSCYNYPSFKQVAVPTSSSTDVVKDLADFSDWSDANAKQVLGLQWQVTSNVASGDTTCPVDVTVTNIKFLP